MNDIEKAKDEFYHTEQKKLVEERFYWKSTRTDEDRISVYQSLTLATLYWASDTSVLAFLLAQADPSQQF